MTGVRINGATRPYAIVGDPIVQVKAPELAGKSDALMSFFALA